jgi:hypothetical protein
MLRPLAAIPLAFCLLSISPARGNSDDPANWIEVLDEATFTAAGLDKLTDAELGVLGRLLVQPAGPSFLEDEAVAFLRQNGWRPVNVAAMVGGKHQIVVLDEEGATCLTAWSSIEPLPPLGVHWAKHFGSWDVLNPDGSVQHYTD